MANSSKLIVSFLQWSGCPIADEELQKKVEKFLCSAYFPACNHGAEIKRPCKAFCECEC